MLKRFYLGVLIIVAFNSVYSQQNNFKTIFEKDKVLNLDSSYFHIIEFNGYLKGIKKIEDNFVFDQTLLQNSENRSLITVLDYKLDTVLWQKKYKRAREKLIFLNDQLLINDGISKLINPKTGKTIWSSRLELKYFQPKKEIVFGFLNYQTHLVTNTLTAFNLKIKEKIWQTDLKWCLDWNNLTPVGDSAILYYRKGLHYLNLISGEKWYIPAKTEITDQTQGMVPILLGGAIGAVIYYGFRNEQGTLYPYQITASNICQKGDTAFVAMDNSIMAVSIKDGRKLWSKKLDYSLYHYSSLEILDSKLVHFSRRFPFTSNKRLIKHQFSLYTGELISREDVSESVPKKLIDQETSITNCQFFGIDKHKVYEIKLIEDSLPKFVEADYFSNYDAFARILEDSWFFEDSDSLKIFNCNEYLNIGLASDSVFTYDKKDLSLVYKKAPSEIYKLVYSKGDFMVFKNYNSYYVSKNNEVKYTFKAVGELFFFEEYVFITNQKELQVLKWSDL